jgi:hypothetical protein
MIKDAKENNKSNKNGRPFKTKIQNYSNNSKEIVRNGVQK